MDQQTEHSNYNDIPIDLNTQREHSSWFTRNVILILGVGVLIILLLSGGIYVVMNHKNDLQRVSPVNTTVTTITLTPPDQPTITMIPTITKQIPSPTIKPTSPYLSPTPIKTPTPTDHIPPTTSFLKTQPVKNENGNVCIGFSPPSDDVTPYDQIETRYSFDNGSWSNFQKQVALACANLSSGNHTIQASSRDQAGNIEPPVTLQFYVP